MQSVLDQAGDALAELLVLDNEPDAGLEREVQQAARRARMPVVYIPVPHVGLHNGRHAAAQHASGTVIAYLDDDVLVQPGWLAGLADAFNDPDVHLVGGPCAPLYESEPPQWLERFWSEADGARWCAPLSLIDAGNADRDVDPGLIFGANFAIRKQTLVDVGGFHPDALPWSLRRFRGDGETWVSNRVRELGRRAVYRPSVGVLHRVPLERMTNAYFERRAFLQGISDSFTDARNLRHDGRRPAIARLSADLRGLAFGVVRKVRRGGSSQELAFAASHLAGYRYHQDQMRVSPVVLEWVMRPTYWDGEVPEGDDR